jgi:hypothetical protein
MPYATGTANNATELRTALTNLATANGWTWDATNEMLYKAPVYGKLTISGLNLFVQSALGYSGATLTTPAAYAAGISSFINITGITVLAYPLTYHVFVHANPDIIVLAVNWGAVWWQWLMFGNGKSLGDEPNPLWHWGSASSNLTGTGQGVYIASSLISNAGGSSKYFGAAPFCPTAAFSSAFPGFNSALYCALDAVDWRYNLYGSGTTNPNNAHAGYAAAPLLQTQPNAWNAETELIRLQPMVLRPSSFWSYVADLWHVRITRNDNFSDGQIITIGPDRWFVAPCFRKDSANRDSSLGTAGGAIAGTHTGTMALAIRYDGP